MSLIIQLKIIVISIVFGILFSYLTKIQYKLLFNSNIIIKSIISFLFVFNMTLLYFLLLKYLNEGIFHINFFLIIILGYIIGNKLIYYSDK